MLQRTLWLFILMPLTALVLMVVVGANTTGKSAVTRVANRPATGTVPTPLRDLTLTISAMQCLIDLDLSAEQIKRLQVLARRAPVITQVDPDPTASAEYVATLQALWEATVKEDNPVINQMQRRIDALAEKEKIDIDDTILVSDAARAAVPSLYNLLSSSQVCGYLSYTYADDFPDPVETLMEDADFVHSASSEDITDTIQEASDEVAIVVRGIDPASYKPLASQVAQWLLKCRTLTPQQYATSRNDLEKSARGLVGNVESFLAMRHCLERDLSRLLANPQLPAAIAVRLRHLPARLATKPITNTR